MNEIELYISLDKKNKEELLLLLKKSYSTMNTQQRDVVFGQYILKEINNLTIEKSDAENIVDEVNDFYVDSMAGVYYAPFQINSKNYMDVPEETEEWCSKIGILLNESSLLTKQNFHKEAVQGFQKLFTLIDKIGETDIIFGDEIGSWMAGGDRKLATTSYISSASQILSDKEFVDHVTSLLIIDSYESFSNEVYKQIASIATKEQFTSVQSIIGQQKIRVPL